MVNETLTAGILAQPMNGTPLVAWTRTKPVKATKAPANSRTAMTPSLAGRSAATRPKAGMICMAWVAKKCATRRSPPWRSCPEPTT